MLDGWSYLEIAGKPAETFDPGPNPSPFAIVWLHDEDGKSPACDPILTDELRRRRLRCLAPLTGPSWWVDRICPAYDPVLTAERFVLDHAAPEIARAARHALLAGIGMGGQGAIRLGLKFPTRFPVVAGLDSTFDFHERYGAGTPLDEMYPSREHCRQDTAILHVHAHHWPTHIGFACRQTSRWFRGNDRLHEKLNAIGVPHSAELDASADTARVLSSLLDASLAALEREARRLA